MPDANSLNLAYNTLLFGVGATLEQLSKEDRELSERLHRRIGEHVIAYLEAKGISLAAAKQASTSEGVVGAVIQLFLEEVKLAERVSEVGDGKVEWEGLLGTPAYLALAAEKMEDPFRACPINAVARHLLHDRGETIAVRSCAAGEEGRLISHEEVVPLRQG